MKKIILLIGYCISIFGFGQSPGDVSGSLQIWIKADVGVTNTGDGTSATAWTDQSLIIIIFPI